MAKQLWQMVRVLYYMIHKGILKHNFLIDLHLLLKCGKIAGKAIGNLLTFHHHHAGNGPSYYSALSCRSMDPNMAFYTPREVQFSCSNTPVRRKHRHHRSKHYNYDAAFVAKVFETLNSDSSDDNTVIASPSPEVMRRNDAKSPAVVRQLRVTDSPFPIKEEGEVDGHVDREAEEFIRRFYEQLRLQQQRVV